MLWTSDLLRIGSPGIRDSTTRSSFARQRSRGRLHVTFQFLDHSFCSAVFWGRTAWFAFVPEFWVVTSQKVASGVYHLQQLRLAGIVDALDAALYVADLSSSYTSWHPRNSEAVMDVVWGSCGAGWLDAHNNWMQVRSQLYQRCGGLDWLDSPLSRKTCTDKSLWRYLVKQVSPANSNQFEIAINSLSLDVWSSGHFSRK